MADEKVVDDQTKLSAWEGRLAASKGLGSLLPVFPVGDAAMEPFWPQGLGSNRGFHTALDAVWAAHVLQQQGLAASLLECSFWFDVMVQGPWNPGLVKPAAGWSADPATRYAEKAIVHMRNAYTNPAGKRLFKGAAATPPRVQAMQLKSGR